MNLTALALLGYIGWFLLLFGAIAILRTGLTVSGKKLANSFKPDGSDVSAFSSRLCRAHANCYESFPYIGGLMLFALATGAEDITNPLALVVLLARILQSGIHMMSTSVRAVQIRFVFFLAQYLVGIYWVTEFFLRVISQQVA
jgi:uncharacterized MAPEG superfamily protein